jgi:hypothetical protein
MANGIIKRGHRPLTNGLSKIIKGEKDRKKWRTHLHLVLFANQTIINSITGHTLFYLVYSREAILPVEGRFPTWQILD